MCIPQLVGKWLLAVAGCTKNPVVMAFWSLADCECSLFASQFHNHLASSICRQVGVGHGTLRATKTIATRFSVQQHIPRYHKLRNEFCLATASILQQSLPGQSGNTHVPTVPGGYQPGFRPVMLGPEPVLNLLLCYLDALRLLHTFYAIVSSMLVFLWLLGLNRD